MIVYIMILYKVAQAYLHNFPGDRGRWRRKTIERLSAEENYITLYSYYISHNKMHALHYITLHYITLHHVPEDDREAVRRGLRPVNRLGSLVSVRSKCTSVDEASVFKLGLHLHRTRLGHRFGVSSALNE